MLFQAKLLKGHPAAGPEDRRWPTGPKMSQAARTTDSATGRPTNIILRRPDVYSGTTSARPLQRERCAALGA